MVTCFELDGNINMATIEKALNRAKKVDAVYIGSPKNRSRTVEITYYRKNRSKYICEYFKDGNIVEKTVCEFGKPNKVHYYENGRKYKTIYTYHE